MEQKRTSIPLRAMVKYALLQIPGLALFGLVLFLGRSWLFIPPLVFWSFLVLWVLKDIILFPFVWRAYDQRENGDTGKMIGTKGVATERLAPSGYIQIHGELWKVEAVGDHIEIEKGEPVQVVGRNNLTLLVKRVVPDQKPLAQTEV